MLKNLHNTDSKYNELSFGYNVPTTSGISKSEREILDGTQWEIFRKIPELIIAEASTLLQNVERIIPEVREQAVKLEAALERNIKLKRKLFR